MRFELLRRVGLQRRLRAGPGLRDPSEQADVHLGVERRRGDVAVAQEGADRVERCALAEQPRRERVAQDVMVSF
jgi:hypothetical protein